MKKIILFLFIIILLTSCSTLMGNLAKSLTESLYRQHDIKLIEDGAPAFLILIESFIYNNPKDRDQLITGIQTFSAYSSAFVKDKERQKIFSDKAKNWAISLLKTYPKYLKYENCDNKEIREKLFTDFLKSLTKKDVPYVFWAANAWINWIIANIDSIEALVDLPIPKAIIDRIKEIDSTYYYGAPHLFYGVYYSLIPEGYGGDMKLAKEEFDKALQLSKDKLLMTKVLYASTYLKATKDKKEFKKILQEVINSDIDLYPEMRLLNIIAKNQAIELLSNIDIIFKN